MAQLQPGANKDTTIQQAFPRSAFMWALVIVGLIIWNIIILWPKANLEAVIPYTTFLDQIRSDNVAKIHMAGEQIASEFKGPFEWPANSQSISNAKSQSASEPETPTSGNPDEMKAQLKDFQVSKHSGTISRGASSEKSAATHKTT